MYQKLKGNRKGFTLAELLIVIAIIAILAAIAIPVYTTQMTKARQRVNEANVRSAISISTAEFMINENTAASQYTFKVVNGNLVMQGDAASGGAAGFVDFTKIDSKTYNNIVISLDKTGQAIGSSVS